MNQAEYVEFHNEWCEKMKAITVAKNTDYCAGSDDAFFNLKTSEHFGLTTTDVSIMTRLLDKVSRICSFINKGSLEVKDEKIEDTLMDLCNYAILLAGYIRTSKAKAKLEAEVATRTYIVEPSGSMPWDNQLYGKSSRETK